MINSYPSKFSIPKTACYRGIYRRTDKYRVMGREQQAIRLVLSAVVGIGFVTPLTTALFQMAGLGRSLAVIGGAVVGIAVAVYIYPRMERVRD